MGKKLPKFNEDSYAHFVTAKTFNLTPFFKDDACCEIFVEEMRFYEKKLNFETIAWVLMPDHVHAIFWWDKEINPLLEISTVMHRIKSCAAARISEYITKSSCRIRVWQRGTYDFPMFNHKKIEEKINYIHTNPVRAGLVLDPLEYRWSSCHEFLEGLSGRGGPDLT